LTRATFCAIVRSAAGEPSGAVADLGAALDGAVVEAVAADGAMQDFFGKEAEGGGHERASEVQRSKAVPEGNSEVPRGAVLGNACIDDEGAIVVGSDLNESTAWAEATRAAPAADFHLLDVRDEAAQHAIAADILARHGRIDGLVTAAGVAGGGFVHMLDLKEWQRVQDVNLTGTFLSCKAVLPTMLKQRSGSIVTVASVEGLEGCEGGSTYNASKGAVVLLTKNMACDYGRAGIRVNAICPGAVDTDMLRPALGANNFEERMRAAPLQRAADPSEIAAFIAYLLSDEASYQTAGVYTIDGGMYR
jgi:NAD(P)-dependent dehydrogenase (short-subunit alcohol dehydrogenase family)